MVLKRDFLGVWRSIVFSSIPCTTYSIELLLLLRIRIEWGGRFVSGARDGGERERESGVNELKMDCETKYINKTCIRGLGME